MYLDIKSLVFPYVDTVCLDYLAKHFSDFHLKLK